MPVPLYPSGAGGTRVAYPLGPQLATVRGNGRHGGQSSTDYQQSAQDTAVVQAPVYSALYSVHIPGGDAASDGSEMQATYHPYVKRVAVYLQPGYQSAAPWQEDQYAEDARALLRPQPVPAGQYLYYQPTVASRPPVSQLDYNLLQAMPLGNDSALETSGYYG